MEVVAWSGGDMDLLRGKVVTGIGDYAQWIEKYQAAYRDKTGMTLFPGTLNVQLDHAYEFPTEKVVHWEGNDYGSRVSVSILPARICGRTAVILRPDLPSWATPDDAAHRLSTLEVATDVKLRDTYGLRDGDEVTVEID